MIKRIFNRIRREVVALKHSNSRKIFCVGMNKTGTTSMAKLFKEMGLAVGSQRPAELLIKDWGKSDYSSLIKYVKYKGVAFQDVPFSLPNTFKVLDREFPNSKFILTIRDSPEVWYRSLTTFHIKMFGKNGNLPSEEDLKDANYVYPGWAWEMSQLQNPTGNNIYDREMLIRSYIDYNNAVMNYFKDKPEKLLVINLKEEEALEKICEFLHVKKIPSKIPWENKT